MFIESTKRQKKSENSSFIYNIQHIRLNGVVLLFYVDLRNFLIKDFRSKLPEGSKYDFFSKFNYYLDALRFLSLFFKDLKMFEFLQFGFAVHAKTF